MYCTEQQILLIESSAEAVASIVPSLRNPSTLIQLEIAVDAASAIRFLGQNIPPRLVMASIRALDDSALSKKLHTGLFPVIVYASAADDYAQVLGTPHVFERILLTPDLLERLPDLISQWRNRWQLQQSQLASWEDQRSAARARLERLSPREQEVLQLVTAGCSNVEVATQLGVSKKTVEKHRARLMSKASAGSLAELVQMVVTVNGGPTISLDDAQCPPPERLTAIQLHAALAAARSSDVPEHAASDIGNP